MLIYLQIIETEEERSKFEQLYEAYRGLLYRVAFARLEMLRMRRTRSPMRLLKSRKISKKSSP